MKLVFFDDFKLGAVKGDNVVDLSAAAEHIPHVSPQDTLSGLIADFDTHKSQIGGSDKRERWRAAIQCAAALTCAATYQHRLHGSELHGERHTLRACAHKCVQQVA